MTQKERSRYRQTKKWKEFRAYMIDQYDNKCFACEGYRKKGMQIHHINPNSYGKETINDVVPLCPACHKELERILRKKKLDIEGYQARMLSLYENGQDAGE